MSSNNIPSDIIEATTTKALEWSAEKIGNLVKSFKERKLAFIKEPKTIEVVREQYRSGEAKFYQTYIKDKNLLLLVRIGLALRKLEKENEKRQNLRDKLFNKYKIEGLHIAELVENGVLNRYIGILIEKVISINDLEKEIEDFLNHVEKHTLFIQWTTKKVEILKNATIKINSNSPHIFVISGVKSAGNVLKECINDLKYIFKEYEMERITGEKEILFFIRKIPSS